MRKLGAKSVIALVVPDPDVAFKILALNTEKAHNLKEKSLETIRMLRALADERAASTERELAFEFDQPSFLTLGAAYEERPRLSGGAYNPVLRRIDEFLDERLPRALKERSRRAGLLLAIDDEVTAHRRQAEEARPHQSVSAAIRGRAHQSDSVLDVHRVRLRRRAREDAEERGEIQRRESAPGGCRACRGRSG